ncbi:phosphatase PAP2 family protein [Paraburkholderia sp. BR10923]|uniref:phosphatase PAP2 family protein n=1 Tax=Paraburkholderia sp. BR10923 TaxID=3236992 RepID=UPI0034CD0A67
MDPFDTAIQTFLTHMALNCATLNHAIRIIADLYTFKGLVLMPALWWIWCKPSQRGDWEREMVVATIASGLLALAIFRLVSHYLPFRTRPLFNPELHLNFPSGGLDAAVLPAWSSFPSDHAMLWISVATGIFLVSRGVGVLALLYTTIFICLPRVYLGWHYPTDIIAGAAIGATITWIMTRDAVRTPIAAPILRWMHRFPGPSYTLSFALCFELVTQFNELLVLGRSILQG